MTTAQYLIALDVGSTFIKGALFQTNNAGQQSLVASIIAPSMIEEQTLSQVIDQLVGVLPQKSSYELVLIGHPPDLSIFDEAANIVRLSHEDALTEVVKRMSSTGTVLAIDIGSRRTMAALGKYGKTTIESFNYGVGIESWNFLRRGMQSDQLRQWLPFDLNNEDVENYIANKSLYPHIIPISPIELGIEQALTKLILRQIKSELTIPWTDINQVILSGAALSQPATISQSMAIFMDGLEPMDAVHVLADTTGTIFACGGAFEQWSPKDYRIGRAILQSTLASLGTVISFGSADNDSRQKVAKIVLDTGLSTEQVLEIRAGEIVTIPLPLTDAGHVEVKQNGAIKAANKPRIPEGVIGGEMGIVIDARSRPLQLLPQDRERRSQLLLWGKQLNIYNQVGVIGGKV